MNVKMAEALIEAIDALRWDIRGVAALSDPGTVFSDNPRIAAREAFANSDASMKRARHLLKLFEAKQ